MQKIQIFISHSAYDNDKIDLLQLIAKKHKSWCAVIIILKEITHDFILNTDKIIAGLEKCEIFIPIITENSIKTQWVNQEIGYIFKRNPAPKIIPIVSKSLRKKLSGFIHKEYNIQNVYDRNSDKALENASFEQCVEQLFKSLSRSYKPKKSKETPFSKLFPGKWKTNFMINGRHYTETFEIKNGSQYFINDKHVMNIDDFRMDESKRKILFTKYPIDPTGKPIGCNLNIVTALEKYEGYEVNPFVKKAVKIGYKRIK